MKNKSTTKSILSLFEYHTLRDRSWSMATSSVDLIQWYLF